MLQLRLESVVERGEIEECAERADMFPWRYWTENEVYGNKINLFLSKFLRSSVWMCAWGGKCVCVHTYVCKIHHYVCSVCSYR